METSKHIGEHTEGAVVPWKFVPRGVWYRLVVMLNSEMPYSGNDWRMLASKLGYSQGEIKFIESEKDTNTNILFKMYSQRKESSLNEIYTCLEEMGRKDCVDIIDKAYEDIQKIATEKSQAHPKDQEYGAAGESSGRYTCTVKCPIHPSGVHICSCHCSCLCSSLASPSLHFPPMSHPDYPRRTAAFMHLINNGTFAPHLAPQHSPTTNHGGLVNSQHSHPLRDVTPDYRTKIVFVTYGKDNKKHEKEVLALCVSLLKNGIGVYVDVKESDVSLDLCMKRMSEADFILICVSPKYLQDVGLGNTTCQQGRERQLHTKEIYARMESECRRSLHGVGALGQARLVLVLFGGVMTAALPPWMTSQAPAFDWPEQHKDLVVKVRGIGG